MLTSLRVGLPMKKSVFLLLLGGLNLGFRKAHPFARWPPGELERRTGTQAQQTAVRQRNTPHVNRERQDWRPWLPGPLLGSMPVQTSLRLGSSKAGRAGVMRSQFARGPENQDRGPLKAQAGAQVIRNFTSLWKKKKKERER